jgi:hypothetical protein
MSNSAWLIANPKVPPNKEKGNWLSFAEILDAQLIAHTRRIQYSRQRQSRRDPAGGSFGGSPRALMNPWRNCGEEGALFLGNFIPAPFFIYIILVTKISTVCAVAKFLPFGLIRISCYLPTVTPPNKLF